MNRSFEGVVTFLRDNDSVLKQLMETAETATQEIGQLATRVDHARDEAQVLIDQLGTVEFSVGRQDETKVKQTALLDAVAALRKKFETYKNDPLRRGIYSAEISNLYLQLANTFNNDTVSQLVPFAQDEIDGYKDLMRKAILDAESRQRRAAVARTNHLIASPRLLGTCASNGSPLPGLNTASSSGSTMRIMSWATGASGDSSSNPNSSSAPK